MEQTKVQVKVYKGERRLKKGLVKMAAAGFVVQDRTSRKQLYSWTTGIFTRKQKHTVTFFKTVTK